MERFLFKYPLELYAQGELILASHWPLWLLAGIVVSGGAWIVVSLLSPAAHLSRAQRGVIGVAQTGLLAAVVVLLWQPSLAIIRLRDDVNSVALLIDASASMAYPDEGVSRQQRAAEVVANEAIAQLGERYDLQRYSFGSAVAPLENGQEAGAGQPETRLLDALTQVLGQRRRQALAAVVLISDGNDVNGRWHADQLAQLAAASVPVHSITMGRQRVPEDIGIAQVLLPQQVVPGSLLRSRVDILHDGAHDIVLAVRAGDQVISVTDHSLPEATDQTSIWVNLALPEGGHQALVFELRPVAGETNLKNNTLTRMVEGAPAAVKVLYIEGEPRWEYKFIRRAVDADKGVQLRSLLRVSPNRFYRQGVSDSEELAAGFPDDPDTLFQYDALIVGSIEAASFSDAQIEMMRDFVAVRGAGLLMLGGRSGLGAGGWGDSLLSGALPSALPSADQDSFVRRPVAVQPAAEGRPDLLPLFAPDPGQNLRLWAQLPAVADFQRLGRLKPAARVLLEAQTDRGPAPLLLRQPFGLGQTYILATGGTWRWQMSLPVEDQRHEQFWRQLLRELAATASPRFSLSTRVEGRSVVVDAQLRQADFSPDPRAALEVSVSDGPGPARRLRLPAVDGPGGSYRARFEPETSQVVYVEPLQPADDGAVTLRSAVFVDTGRAEFATMRANRTQLEALSAATGGRHWSVEQLDHLPDAIARSSAGVSERQILAVWDAPIVFLLLLALKSAEWLLRRRWSVL